MSSQQYITLQKKAKAHFEQLGMPSRRDEDWKYTPTDTLSKHAFQVNHDALTITFKGLPDGVLALPLQEAIDTHTDLVMPHLGKILEAKHGFHAQNLAFFELGFFIHVPKGMVLDAPIEIVHHVHEAGGMHCVRHLIVLEAGSGMNLTETYVSDLEDPYFTNAITEIALAPDAQLSHVKIQREGVEAFHVGDVAAKQAKGSQFESHSLSLGALWARSDTHIALKAPHAQCLLNGIYLPRGAQHIDHHTTVMHEAVDCVSAEDYKGILRDKARAVFNGKVIVSEHASGTEARQYNKNVLLSPHAEVNTKPELQIFTDDVVCAHGATVGELDEEALFYLATRGIDDALAHQYLMQAFLADNLKKMAINQKDGILHQLIEKHME